MELDQKEARAFRRLNTQLINLEKASAAREKDLKQLAEKLGVEIDLTPVPTAGEEYEEEMIRNASRHLLESEEVKAYMRESEEGDVQ